MKISSFNKRIRPPEVGGISQNFLGAAAGFVLFSVAFVVTWGVIAVQAVCLLCAVVFGWLAWYFAANHEDWYLRKAKRATRRELEAGTFRFKE